jgi:hypothetical protein
MVGQPARDRGALVSATRAGPTSPPDMPARSKAGGCLARNAEPVGGAPSSKEA